MPRGRSVVQIAPGVLASFHTCPIPEIAQLGPHPASLAPTVPGHFTTGRANNGSTEAQQRHDRTPPRIARGYRNPTNYRLRMILAAGHHIHPHLPMSHVLFNVEPADQQAQEAVLQPALGASALD